MSTSPAAVDRLTYHRCRLLVTPGRSSAYVVHALTQMGQGRAHFGAQSVGDDAGSWLRFPYRRPARDLVREGAAPVVAAQSVGEQLFAALFQDEVRSLFERSLDLAVDAGAGLRIELTFDPRDPDLAFVQTLPWELLRQPGSPKFLALSHRTPVTRFLAVPRPVHAAARPHVLRVLAVAADPRDPALPALDLAQELRNLRAAAGAAVEVVPVAPTMAALRQAVRERECHVLHFMGHGAAGERENVLLFRAEDGRPDPVSGTDLANTLADARSLRLVVLNACESGSVAESGAGGAFSPFTGVANALVLGDLPAVVAMQHPISDRAAITFSRAFYAELAAGAPVDAAVTEGRRAVHAEDRESLEWSTPVLFMRTPTGELFPEEDLWDRRAGGGRLRWMIAALLALLLAAGAGVAFRHWRVERLVTEGAALFGQERWDSARARFEAARRLQPGSAEVLSNLAGAEERLGHLRAAEGHYREAVQRQPDSAEHLYNLGHFLTSRESYDEAYRFLLAAVAQDSRRAGAHAELAQVAGALGMPGRARAHLEVALRLDPERPALHRRRGELELDSGNPHAAIPHLDEALRRYPLGDLGRVETTWLLARAYDRLGNARAACREVLEVRRLDPPGITPWARAAEEMGVRRGCPVDAPPHGGLD